MEDEDSNLKPTIEEIRLYQRQLKILQAASRTSPDGQKVCYTARLPIYCDGELEYISVHLEEEKYLRYTKLLQESLDMDEAEEELIKQAKGETWSSRWIASPMAYLLDRRQREEWLGDIKDVEREMLNKRQFPRWWINFIIIGRVAILLKSILEVRQIDSRHAQQRKTE